MPPCCHLDGPTCATQTARSRKRPRSAWSVGAPRRALGKPPQGTSVLGHVWPALRQTTTTTVNDDDGRRRRRRRYAFCLTSTLPERRVENELHPHPLRGALNEATPSITCFTVDRDFLPIGSRCLYRTPEKLLAFSLSRRSKTQDDPRGPQDRHKTAQEAPKTAQESPKTQDPRPKTAQEAPKTQDNRRGPQDCPKSGPRGRPKIQESSFPRPRGPQEAPRRPQEVPGSRQEPKRFQWGSKSPRGPQEPKKHQKDPKRPQNGPQELRDLKTTAQRPARGVPRDPNEDSRCV